MPLSSTTNDIGGAAESAYENFAALMSWDELTVGLNLADCGTYVSPSECESERFASFTMCATINLVMSALIFTGDLQEVLPGKLAVRGNRGEQCAVCETCKGFICKVLR